MVTVDNQGQTVMMAATRGLIQSYLFLEKFVFASRYVPNRAYGRRLHRNPIKVFPDQETGLDKLVEKPPVINNDPVYSKEYEIASKLQKSSESYSYGIKKFESLPSKQVVKEKVNISKKVAVKIVNEKQTAERKLG